MWKLIPGKPVSKARVTIAQLSICDVKNSGEIMISDISLLRAAEGDHNLSAH